MLELKRIIKGKFVVVFGFLLLGCQATKEVDIVQQPIRSFVEPASPKKRYTAEDDQGIFYLTPEQLNTFTAFYNQQLSREIKPHQAVVNYLEDSLENFNYYGETLNASQSLEQGRGNCMSLAILTTALANHVNLEMDYRLVLSEPIYGKSSGIITYSRHVQTRLFDPTFVAPDDMLYLLKPHLLVDYFPNPRSVTGDYIEKNDFLTLYYQNKSAEALKDDNVQQAYSFAYRAYQLNSQNLSSMNILAVVSRRLGNVEQAEALYKQALLQEHDNLFALNNYHALLVSQSRIEEAHTIKLRLADAQDPNPFYLMALGDKYLKRNEVGLAHRYYNKAINNAPYLSEPYKKVFQLLSSLGREEQAEKYLVNALEWVHRPEERKQLKYKLYGRNVLSLEE